MSQPSRMLDRVMRHCDGADRNLIGEDGHSPCTCGLRFDDIGRLVIWPHHPIPSPLEKQAILDELFAAHAACPDTCDIARVGRLTGEAVPTPPTTAAARREAIRRLLPRMEKTGRRSFRITGTPPGQ